MKRLFFLTIALGCAVAAAQSRERVQRREARQITFERQVELQKGFDHSDHSRVIHDFNLAAGATLELPLVEQDTSAAGSPTTDYVDDASEYNLLTDAQDEDQELGLSYGDHLIFDVTKNPVFEARLKIDADAIPWSADQRLVVGMASNRNATLDSVTTHAWFRLEGADATLLTESDDNTTNDDDNDSGIDISDDSWFVLRIDMADLTAVQFDVDLEDGEGFQSAGTLAMSAAAGNLQPFIEMQRDAGTQTESLHLDYISVSVDR